MSKEFKKEIENGLSAICDKIGFKKKQYYFIKQIDNNVMAVLEFGIYEHKQQGHIFVDVSIGLSFKNVEKLLYLLLDRDKVIFGHTILKQIGYLMPENTYKEWDFVENANNNRVFEDLLKNIQTFGFPYQEKMKHFDNLLQYFEIRDIGVLHIARDKYLPILYYIKGEKEKGLQVIEDAIERMSKRPTEEEIRAKMGNLQNMTIIRYDDKRTAEEIKEIEKNLPSGGSMVFVGAGYDGIIDPMYLKFVENYKKI